MTEIITINKSEFDDLMGLKNEIKNIKENYISRDEFNEKIYQNQIYFDVAKDIDKKIKNKEMKVLDENEVL